MNAWNSDVGGEPVTFRYMNYQGKTEKRTVIPIKIWYGTTPWHPDFCWLLRAVDLKRKAMIDFKIIDIEGWSERAP